MLRGSGVRLLLGVVMACLVISGCNYGSSTAGKFESTSRPGSYIELKPDGTFFYKQTGDNVDWSGKYTVANDEVRLTTPMGVAFTYKLKGDSLTGDGETFRRK